MFFRALQYFLKPFGQHLGLEDEAGFGDLVGDD